MARREGLVLVSSLFGVIAVYLTGCLVGASASAEGFQDLPTHILHRHISVARNLPLCILLRNEDDNADGRSVSNLEQTVIRVWKSARNTSSWQIGSYIYTSEQSTFMQKPDTFPMLRCFLGQSVFFDYYGRAKKQLLSKWLDKLYLKHLEQRRELTVSDLDSISRSHRLTLLALPDHSHFHTVEEIASKVCEESRLQCRAVVVHPHSQHVRAVQSAFAIRSLPAVLVMDRLDPSEPVNQTFYHQDVTLSKLLCYVLAREVSATHLTLVNFRSEVLQVERRSGYRPYLVAIYASWAEEVQPFLRFLALAAEELPSLGAQLSFGLLDASVQKQVISRYIQPEFAVSLPCLLVFYLSEEGVVEQRRVEVVHPSPFQVVAALQRALVPVLDRQARPLTFQPFGAIGPHNDSLLTEGPRGTQCSAWSHRDTDNEPWTDPGSGRKKSSEPAPVVKQTPEGVPYVSKEQWRDLVQNKGKLGQEASSLPDSHAHVTLVVFLIADCSSCSNNMPVFSKIHQAVSQLGRAMFLVNCSAERTLCREEGVAGFPTVTVYRVPHVEGSPCVRQESLQLHSDISRLDYHGTVQAEPILQWFQAVSADVVAHTSTPVLAPGWKDETVQLMATLVPRKSRFLPLPPGRNWDYFWSPSCFRLVCERLLGLAACHSSHSHLIPASQFSAAQSEPDLVVTQVTFRRRDGVEAVVMELGRPLMESVEDSSKDADFHFFPHTHSYGLSSRQLCEENHWACSDFLAAFVRDHARLPVSPLSSASFHTRNSPYLQDGLPIVAALVYQDNITQQSEFYQMLQTVGRQLYTQVVLVTVDVELYPAWVGHFVPLHYYRDRQAGAVQGDLLAYPRFCLFYWSDHRHAAFFPPVAAPPDRQPFTAASLVAFIHSVLHNPKAHLVVTEQF